MKLQTLELAGNYDQAVSFARKLTIEEIRQVKHITDRVVVDAFGDGRKLAGSLNLEAVAAYAAGFAAGRGA